MEVELLSYERAFDASLSMVSVPAAVVPGDMRCSEGLANAARAPAADRRPEDVLVEGLRECEEWSGIAAVCCPASLGPFLSSCLRLFNLQQAPGYHH